MGHSHFRSGGREWPATLPVPLFLKVLFLKMLFLKVLLLKVPFPKVPFLKVLFLKMPSPRPDASRRPLATPPRKSHADM
ncbi:hypothetical protein VSR68_00615 [Paraburkholderia phymatum]|uniref:hypothetical protein n=1 Tax=Paraburkholderia phymatum TaxID=148447 RepID=UPI00317F4285